MANIVNHLFGLLMPSAAGRRDAPAAPTPPMQIPGAHAARELCMLPTDAVLPIDIDPEAARRSAKIKRVVQLKADGIHAIRIDGRIVSREGAPLDCALHCAPGLDRIEAAAGMGPLVFDGEYVAQDGFNATLGEHKAGKGDGVFWAYDVLPLADWRRGRCDMPVEARLAMLRDLVVGYGDSLFVGMLDFWLLDPIEALTKAREIWAAGGEGIVTKRLGSPYVRGRSEDWLRVKETHTVDAQIMDIFPRADGTLHRMSLRLERRDSPKPMTIVVGTGWTEEEGRALVRNHAAGTVGQWAEISFQLSTGERRAIRGARFHRIRASKGISA